jgi:hypothetical protein
MYAGAYITAKASKKTAIAWNDTPPLLPTGSDHHAAPGCVETEDLMDELKNAAYADDLPAARRIVT